MHRKTEEREKKQSPLEQAAAFIVDKRKAFYLFYIGLAIFCVVANGWVEVNDDLTSYLPDTTETRQGLDTMEAEFTTFGTNRIMVDNIDYARASLLEQRLEALEGVKSVEFDDTEDHFELIGVTQAVADFALSHSHVQLDLERLPFTECADRVIYGELDLAFLILRHRERLPPDLISRPVYRSRLVMVVWEDCPAQTCEEAIRSLDLLLVQAKPRGNSRILKALEDMGLEPNIRRVDSITSGFVYTQMGAGIMLLSETYYNNHRYPGLRAIQVDSDAAWITHEVVWNRGTQNPSVQLLLDSLPQA